MFCVFDGSAAGNEKSSMDINLEQVSARHLG